RKLSHDSAYPSDATKPAIAPFFCKPDKTPANSCPGPACSSRIQAAAEFSSDRRSAFWMRTDLRSGRTSSLHPLARLAGKVLHQSERDAGICEKTFQKEGTEGPR